MTTLPRSRGGRRYLARIRHKGVEVSLGIYESPGLAGFAFNVASEAIGRGSRPPNEVPPGDQPDADSVRLITARVRRRLNLDPPSRRLEEFPPEPEAIVALFEMAIVGFWRDQAGQGDEPGVDAAARRLADSARVIFWSRSRGHPDPSEALARLMSRRLDRTFRRSDLSRAILDDDGDEDWRVARWLVLPDVFPPARGFRDEVRFLYPELFEGETASHSPHWAVVLGIDPPFGSAKVRDAYRARSKSAHPDAGGSHVDFIRLQAAYDEARDYCRIMGI